MLSLTKMLTEEIYFGDELRYTAHAKEQRNGVAEGRGPVVVWNYTRQCNLKCVHCYSNSTSKSYEDELTTAEALKLIDDLATFKVPVLLFSGGEPLLRKDFFVLAQYAAQKGIRPTLSTNGTLITREVAERIKATGVGYVGISLDGLEATNDHFRGVQGAFNLALQGIRNCCAVGQRVGLRFTLNKHNYQEVSAILDLLETEKIDRICFYHLVYSGRGAELMQEDLTHEETRAILDLIMDKTIEFHQRDLKKEILMVDNHADAVYLYLKYKQLDAKRGAYIKKLLENNGGNRSGMAFANIDNEGNVHPDQFTQHHNLGNVKARAFADIWTDETNPLLAGLKNRKPLLQGRCPSCAWLELCNGNFRARGEAATGDFWGYDPACFLTDEECGVKGE